MPGRGDSSFPCAFPAAMTKAYESQQKQVGHVGSGWRAERITGEGLGAAPGVPCREAIIRMQGSYLDVWGASISHSVWLLHNSPWQSAPVFSDWLETFASFERQLSSWYDFLVSKPCARGRLISYLSISQNAPFGRNILCGFFLGFSILCMGLQDYLSIWK